MFSENLPAGCGQGGGGWFGQDGHIRFWEKRYRVREKDALFLKKGLIRFRDKMSRFGEEDASGSGKVADKFSDPFCIVQKTPFIRRFLADNPVHLQVY